MRSIELHGHVTEIKQSEEYKTKTITREATVTITRENSWDPDKLRIPSDELNISDAVRILVVPVEKLTDQEIAEAAGANDLLNHQFNIGKI